MKTWILSIVGVIFLNIMLDIVSPEGKTNAFIKSIFIIMFMYVILSPIIRLIKNVEDIDYSKYFIAIEGISNNEETEQIISELQLKIQEYIAKNGINGVNVKIDGRVSNNEVDISNVNVDLSNIVLNIKDKHINKYKLITELIMDIVEVGEEQIIYV